MLLGLIPLGLAAILMWRLGPLATDSLANFLTVFSILAAVLMALVAVVQNAVGGIDLTKKYDLGQRLAHERQVIRLEVLRELYASISFTVLLLLASMGPIVLLQVASPGHSAKKWLSGLVYLASCAVAISSFYIIFGVYRVLDVQADQAADALHRGEPRSPAPASPSPDVTMTEADDSQTPAS
jgi:Na+/melibiose symporter-like transporter